jgi:hypothetical protein
MRRADGYDRRAIAVVSVSGWHVTFGILFEISTADYSVQVIHIGWLP